ncbi:MAG: CaiB/BaiF CoA transferase family protein [Microthrixaceae bacterium]
MSDCGALCGARVLDLASVGPAARASRILADYGADVVKVGAVPRAGATQIIPPHYAYSGNRGMRRAAFDLKSDDGREAFLKLADRADVVIESFRPGVAARLGIGPGDLLARNPQLVYCSTSGFGQYGPRSQWAGHDLNYLAVGGFLDCSSRREDGRPALPGATVADIAAGGMQAAMSIMAALLERHRTGTGQHLDVSIADGVLAMMSLYADEYLATGVEPGPGHYILTGRYACYEIYECGDGRFISVGAIEPQFWANLCRLLEVEQWTASQTDDSVQDQIRADLAERFATRGRDEWVALLGPADCCVAPVNTVAEAVVDEQFVARNSVVDAEHPQAGPFRQLAPIWAGTQPIDGVASVPDGTVSDAAALLTEAGCEDDRISAWLDEGVIA